MRFRFKVKDRVRYKEGGQSFTGTIKGTSKACSHYFVHCDHEDSSILRIFGGESLELLPDHVKIPTKPIAKEKIKKGQKVWLKGTIDSMNCAMYLKTSGEFHISGIFTPEDIYEREDD